MYFILIFMLPSILDLMQADHFLLNSTPHWSDQYQDSKILSWSLFVVDQWHTIFILVFLLAQLMTQALVMNTFGDQLHETAISFWAWCIESSALIAIGLSCLAWILWTAFFANGPYRPNITVSLLFAEWMWNWLGYLLLGVGKSILLRSYIERTRVTSQRQDNSGLSEGVEHEESIDVPHERSSLLESI